MNKKEIKEYCEEGIRIHCEEFDLEREEAIEVVMLNIIETYYDDKTSEEWMMGCANYLGYDLDIEKIHKEKSIRKKRKEQRQKRGLVKKLAKKLKIAPENINCVMKYENEYIVTYGESVYAIEGNSIKEYLAYEPEGALRLRKGDIIYERKRLKKRDELKEDYL